MRQREGRKRVTQYGDREVKRDRHGERQRQRRERRENEKREKRE